MAELPTYTPEDIILLNLKETQARFTGTWEQETAHLCDLAAEIAAEYTDSGTFLSSLPAYRLPTPPKDTPLPFAVLSGYSTWHRIFLCREIGKRLPSLHDFWQDSGFFSEQEPEPAALNRISYQRSRYTDAAFLRFARHLPEARATYEHSFRSVCEDVFNGVSEYCILPLENSAEGRLSSFSRLIEEYDLKIAAICLIGGDGGDRVTRFALLRKNLSLFSAFHSALGFFDFSAVLTGDPAPTDLLGAARFCGLGIYHVEISPSDGERSLLHAVLRADGDDISAFLLYLFMEVPQFKPLGFYPELSEA